LLNPHDMAAMQEERPTNGGATITFPVPGMTRQNLKSLPDR